MESDNDSITDSPIQSNSNESNDLFNQYRLECEKWLLDDTLITNLDQNKYINLLRNIIEQLLDQNECLIQNCMEIKQESTNRINELRRNLENTAKHTEEVMLSLQTHELILKNFVKQHCCQCCSCDMRLFEFKLCHGTVCDHLSTESSSLSLLNHENNKRNGIHFETNPLKSSCCWSFNHIWTKVAYQTSQWLVDKDLNKTTTTSVTSNCLHNLENDVSFLNLVKIIDKRLNDLEIENQQLRKENEILRELNSLLNSSAKHHNHHQHQQLEPSSMLNGWQSKQSNNNNNQKYYDQNFSYNNYYHMDSTSISSVSPPSTSSSSSLCLSHNNNYNNNINSDNNQNSLIVGNEFGDDNSNNNSNQRISNTTAMMMMIKMSDDDDDDDEQYDIFDIYDNNNVDHNEFDENLKKVLKLSMKNEGRRENFDKTKNSSEYSNNELEDDDDDEETCDFRHENDSGCSTDLIPSTTDVQSLFTLSDNDYYDLEYLYNDNNNNNDQNQEQQNQMTTQPIQIEQRKQQQQQQNDLMLSSTNSLNSMNSSSLPALLRQPPPSTTTATTTPRSSTSKDNDVNHDYDYFNCIVDDDDHNHQDDNNDGAIDNNCKNNFKGNQVPNLDRELKIDKFQSIIVPVINDDNNNNDNKNNNEAEESVEQLRIRINLAERLIPKLYQKLLYYMNQRNLLLQQFQIENRLREKCKQNLKELNECLIDNVDYFEKRSTLLLTSIINNNKNQNGKLMIKNKNLIQKKKILCR